MDEQIKPVAYRNLLNIGCGYVWGRWFAVDEATGAPWEVIKTEYAYDQQAIDTLRAEVERLRAEVALCDKDYKELSFVCTCLTARGDRAEAEVERLRRTLAQRAAAE